MVIRFGVYGVILFLLAAVLLPQMAKSRVTMSFNTCAFHQMWIETAKRSWAQEHRRGASDTPSIEDILLHMRRVTPKWSGRAVTTIQVPTQFPNCKIHDAEFVIGTVGELVQCPKASEYRWDEAEYRFHYGLRKN